MGGKWGNGSGVFRGALCEGPLNTPRPLSFHHFPHSPFGWTAVIFVTILGLFLAPFRDKIAATSAFFGPENALKCVCGRVLRPGPRWGSLQRSPALPTCLLLTHVALCQRVRCVIARTRYINVLTYLLTYLRQWYYRLCKFRS